VKLTPTAKFAAHSGSFYLRFHFISSHLQGSLSNLIPYTLSLLSELHAKDIWQEMSIAERKAGEVTADKEELLVKSARQ
jgi:hypothetical protein